MRIDPYTGEKAPETLGEYRDYCVAFGGEECRAVKFLDKKILDSKLGHDEKVLAPDSQMRAILMPLLTGVDDSD